MQHICNIMLQLFAANFLKHVQSVYGFLIALKWRSSSFFPNFDGPN